MRMSMFYRAVSNATTYVMHVLTSVVNFYSIVSNVFSFSV